MLPTLPFYFAETIVKSWRNQESIMKWKGAESGKTMSIWVGRARIFWRKRSSMCGGQGSRYLTTEQCPDFHHIHTSWTWHCWIQWPSYQQCFYTKNMTLIEIPNKNIKLSLFDLKAVSEISYFEERVRHVGITWYFKTWPSVNVANGLTYLKDFKLF